MALQIIVMAQSIVFILLVMNAIVRTLVVPRGTRSFVVDFLIYFLIWFSKFFNLFVKSFKSRDKIFSHIGPFSILILPIVWSTAIVFGFSGIFWALEYSDSYLDALSLSGSSITTLGFISAGTGSYSVIVFSVIEGFIGLGIVALVFGYLPTIYSIFRSREIQVSKWANLAGSPPSLERLIALSNTIHLLEEMTEDWKEWEGWFAAVRESHLSYPMLNFFRSPILEDSWILTAENVLDSAAFIEAAVDTPDSIHGQLCIKAGSDTLRSIADYYHIHYPSDPNQGDSVEYTKEDFLDLCNRMESIGVNIKSDREQAWKDFSGWRVNYEASLLGIEKLVNIYI